MSLCKNCGQENLDETVFCTNCGASLQEEPVVEVLEGEVVGQKPKTSKLPLVGLIVGIVSVAGFIGGLLMSLAGALLNLFLIPIRALLSAIPALAPFIGIVTNTGWIENTLPLGFALIGLVVGIVGIVINIMAMKKAKANGEKSALAVVGLILSIVGIVLCGVLGISKAFTILWNVIWSILAVVFPSLLALLSQFAVA